MFDELAMDLFDEESLEFYPEIEFSGPNQIKSPEMEDYFLDREKTFKSKYDDFQTIDWLKEKIYSRSRSLNYADTFKYGTYSTKIKILWEEYSVTILLLLIGIVGAFTAFIVSVGVHYFSDIREGYCSYNLLLNQQECCWKYSYDQVKCDQWKLWSDLFNFKINSIESYIINYIFYVLMSVTLSSLSCYLVLNLAPYAAGGGISEIKIILSGFVMRGFLGFGTYTIKTIALILSASSGLMLGQEGPMVHIVCCISNLFIRLFPRFRNNEADKREILVAGSAAGVALSFNAPITGVLFSLEETSFYFSATCLGKSFFVALVGAFVLSSCLPYSNENMVLYSVSPADWHIFELPLFAMIGIFGGLYGAIFTKCTIWWNSFKQKIRFMKLPMIEVVLVTVVTSLVCFPFSFARMSNHHLVTRLFKSCVYQNSSDENYCQRVLEKFQHKNPYGVNASMYIVQEIAGVSSALIIKLILLIFTFGLQVPCGIFVPSIVLGSLLGRIVGLGLEYFTLNYPYFYLFKTACSNVHRCVYPSLYAIVGGAAVLGGITHMTVCVVIMMIEITGKLNYILPLILSVMMAKWVSNALLKYGIYEEISFINNYPFLSNKQEICLPYSIEYCFSTKHAAPLITLNSEGMSLVTISELMKQFKFSGYPIVTSENLLYGYVSYNDLYPIISKKLMDLPETSYINCILYFTSTISSSGASNISQKIGLKHIVDLSPVTLHPKAHLNSMVYIFQKLGVRHILVADQGIPIRIITRKDMILKLQKLDEKTTPLIDNNIVHS